MATLTVHLGSQSSAIIFDAPQPLSGVLIKAGFAQAHPCGGKGTCGKCVVKLLGSVSLPNALEQKAGVRLSCQAQLLNEAPFALSFFPDGDQGETTQAALLEGEGVQLTAMRPAQDGKSLIVRLFESTGTAKKAKISLPLLKAEAEVELGAYEIRTLKIDLKSGAVEEANLLD